MSSRPTRHTPGLAALALAALACHAATAHAAGWPSQPVRLIVPYPPGGSTDVLTRELGHQLSLHTGQPFIVENRPGAGGWTGSMQLARSAPDGYTLGLGTGGSHGLSQLFSSDSPFDPFHDFTPIINAAIMPIAIAVHPSVPAATVGELVAWAKAEKQVGEVSYGVPGVGSPHHVAGAALNTLADNRLNAIAYKGSGQSITDLVGGHIPVITASLSTVIPHHQQDRLRILGVVESERASVAPEIPTAAESLPGYAMPASWLGYFGPANMDPGLVQEINQAFATVLQKPEVRQAIANAGLQATHGTPEAFAAQMRDDVATYRGLIAQTGLQIER